LTSLRVGNVASDGTLVAINKDGRFLLEFEAFGLFCETKVRPTEDPRDFGGETAHNQYGMRYYPYVSSTLTGRIIIAGVPLGLVVVDLPDAYRVIWHGASVLAPGAGPSILHHGYGLQRSRFIFTWSEQTQPGEYNIEIHARMGGAKLLRLLRFPLYYAIPTLFLLAVASFSQTSVLMGALGAAWIFLLQQWSAADLPQRNTLLAHVYAIEAVVIAAWALIWSRLQPLAASLFTVPVLAIGAILFVAYTTFEQTGRLPALVERYWYGYIRFRTSLQRRKWENRRKVKAS
jgi:hypothetical protein